MTVRIDAGASVDVDVSRIMGLDEAGRGSLVGPLVVGGFVAPASAVPRLREIGVRDSKALRPGRREELLAELNRIGQCLVRRIPPATIDRWVSHNGLNQLEARFFGRLVRFARPGTAYVDACDPIARRFGHRVAQSARTPTIVVARHRADEDLPIVAAASIVAKVDRDRWIRRLEHTLGTPVGSGYPSDPRTTQLVESMWTKDGHLPSWVRHSWSTTERLKLGPTAGNLDGFS